MHRMIIIINGFANVVQTHGKQANYNPKRGSGVVILEKGQDVLQEIKINLPTGECHQ